MSYYAIIQNGEITGKGQCRSSGYGIFSIEITEQQYNEIEKYCYDIENEAIILDPNYEEKQKQKRQEELNNLNLTKADFWIALLDRDITKAMVKDKINLIQDEKLKAKTLIRLDDADHFWRGDPSMDIIGAMFGITPEDLNYLFTNKSLPEGEINE